MAFPNVQGVSGELGLDLGSGDPRAGGGGWWGAGARAGRDPSASPLPPAPAPEPIEAAAPYKAASGSPARGAALYKGRFAL